MIYGIYYDPHEKYGKAIRTRKAVSAIVNSANFSHRRKTEDGAWYKDAGLGAYIVFDKAYETMKDIPFEEASNV